MYKIGEELTQPETGWRRVHYLDTNFTFSGNWSTVSYGSYFMGSSKYTNTTGSTVKFKFTGTKIRIITPGNEASPDGGARGYVTIDGVREYKHQSYSPYINGQVVTYEKLDLPYGQHEVIVECLSGNYFHFMAIDIDDQGHLCNPSCDHSQKLTFYKTLSKNIPESIEVGLQEVHFTEKGEIITFTNEGTPVRCNTGELIKEVSNPLTINPLEYGTFKISSDRAISANTIIPFDVVTNGNMSIPANGNIKLHKGVVYNIQFDIYATSSAIGSIRLECYNVTTNEVLATGAKATTNNTDNIISSAFNTSITPVEDIEIGFRPNVALTTLHSAHTYLNIQEIRNNPVNQYGGFETEVLFDGSMQEYGEYILADNINNYSLIGIERIMPGGTDTDLTPIMTSNTTPSPYVASSTSLFNSSAEFAYHYFLPGGNPVTESAKGFIQLDYGNPVSINKVVITPILKGSSRENYRVQDFEFYGSNDGSLYDLLYSDTDVATKYGDNNHVHEFDESVTYRFYKLVCTKSLSVSRFGVNQIRFFMTERYDVTKDFQLFPVGNKGVMYGNYKLTIEEDKVSGNLPDYTVKITGIKGQIPSLLVGGEF